MKVQDLMDSNTSLQVIGSIKLNTALKFRLGRIIKQVRTVVSEAEESRLELIKREGGKLAGNGTYAMPDVETAERVDRECKELFKEEVEIVFDKFSEDAFEKMDIASNDIANCWWLFRETDAEPDPALIPVSTQSNGDSVVL